MGQRRGLSSHRGCPHHPWLVQRSCARPGLGWVWSQALSRATVCRHEASPNHAGLTHWGSQSPLPNVCAISGVPGEASSPFPRGHPASGQTGNSICSKQRSAIAPLSHGVPLCRPLLRGLRSTDRLTHSQFRPVKQRNLASSALSNLSTHSSPR